MVADKRSWLWPPAVCKAARVSDDLACVAETPKHIVEDTAFFSLLIVTREREEWLREMI